MVFHDSESRLLARLCKSDNLGSSLDREESQTMDRLFASDRTIDTRVSLFPVLGGVIGTGTWHAGCNAIIDLFVQVRSSRAYLG